MAAHHIFITGGTGYVGLALIPQLQARGHTVRALVRPGRSRLLRRQVEWVAGDALDAASFTSAITPADTFIHLVGTPRPSPAKAEEFRAVDLISIQATVSAACSSGVRHLIYVSVAHPAPVMQAYVAVRQSGEKLIRESGLNATILRPWYVLGPGHRWPYLLIPVYAILRRVPRTRDSARRLGLLTLGEMVAALVRAVEDPPAGIRVLDVPAIRGSGGA